MLKRFFNFGRSNAAQRGKEQRMAEQQSQTATPPAGSGGNPDVTKLVNDAVAAAIRPLAEGLKTLGETQKTITDSLAKLGPQKADAAGQQGQEKPLTLADVTKVVTEAIASQNASQANATARSQFVAANLGKLPPAYQAQLGQDPAKWAEEAKAIQSQFEGDLKGMGVKLESLGTPAGDGGKTPSQEKPDYSKLPAFERLNLGVEKLPVPAQPAEAEAKK